VNYIQTARRVKEEIDRKRLEDLVPVKESTDSPYEINEFNEINPGRVIQREEAVRLYRERGWIKIYSAFIKTSFYLVRDNSVEVPDRNIAKLTPAELESLKGLSREELLTMHEAKMIFGGFITQTPK